MGNSNLRLRSSVVYFAQRASDGCIKIGATTDLDARIAALQRQWRADTITLLSTVPGGRYEEAQFHRALGRWRLDGEWFRPAPDVFDAAAGELRTSSDPDPFDGVTGPARTLPSCGKVSRDELRRKIVLCFNEGMTGRETAHTLAISPAKLRREVEVMDRLGHFDA